MREEFEKMPEIEQGLRHCHYNESTNIYHADAAHVEEFEWHTQFVNGAWYAFQEQQKKIDLFNKMILSLRNEFNLWADDTESFNAIEAQIENLEDLLK